MADLKVILDELVTLVDDKKAEDISVFHVAEKNWTTEFVFVCSMKNAIHGKALVQDLMTYMGKICVDYPKDFYDPLRLSGSADSGWVIIDGNSIVIHCLDKQHREFYNIDTLFEKQGTVFHY